jgi:uncharacterized protein YndB with AHSA1/START domain
MMYLHFASKFDGWSGAQAEEAPAVEEIADEVIVNAPVDRVWKAIAEPGEHVTWHPFATRIDGEHALGEVRRCSVVVGGKLGTTAERCSAYDEASTITWTVEQDGSGFSRMVTDWRTGFSLQPQGPGATRVKAESLFRPKPLTWLMMPVIRRKFHQTQQAILDGLKQHVER